MLTGLNVMGPVSPFRLLDKPTHWVKTKDVGGWTGYISTCAKTGLVDQREHTAFLNMWLEKFIFCGSTLEPTSNHQGLAEHLARGDTIPLGKYLLGVAYSLLHQVAVKLSVGEPIGNTGAPWWFIQLWLNLATHQAMGRTIKDNNFLASDFTEKDEATTRRCMSFGEAASAIPGLQLTRAATAQIFKSLYHGFTKETTIWFAYDEADDFELPFNFRFLEACNNEASTLMVIITPGVRPIGFHSGHSRNPTYEFYYPSVAARQLGFGQSPIGLHFANKLRTREPISSGLEFDRIHTRASAFPSITLTEWAYGAFSSRLFSQWWSDWKKHIFCQASMTYCQKFDVDYVESGNEGIDEEPHSTGRDDQPM